MARYSRKRRSRRHSSLRSLENKNKPVQNTQSTQRSSTSKSANKGGFKTFLRKHIRIVAVAVFVLIVGGFVLGILLSGKSTDKTADSSIQTSPGQTEAVFAGPTDMPEEAFSEYSEEAGYNYDDVDESVLAGLTGSDESLFSDDAELEDAIFAAEGIRIGVTLGDLNSDIDKLYLSKLEQTSNDYEVDRLVYEVYYYNAEGSFNQQLQDVRSLIKNEVDAIIVGNTNTEAFRMVVAMADEAGIPVVTYNAPEDAEGYQINIVPDDAKWGTQCGQFMAQNLLEGNVLQILGSEKSEVDTIRAAAINQALLANDQLILEDVIYADWDGDDAQDALENFFEEEGYVSGIITEEGMAMGILDAYIDIQKLPKVMCGDVSAGFIKKWHDLKTKGIDLTIESDDDDEEDTVVNIKAGFDEMTVLAQPAPVNIGAVAFEIAYKLAQGRTLKTTGQTFVYNAETVITNDNLPKYYAMVMDKEDDYLLRDVITEETLESLLSPAQEPQDSGE